MNRKSKKVESLRNTTFKDMSILKGSSPLMSQRVRLGKGNFKSSDFPQNLNFPESTIHQFENFAGAILFCKQLDLLSKHVNKNICISKCTPEKLCNL